MKKLVIALLAALFVSFGQGIHSSVLGTTGSVSQIQVNSVRHVLSADGLDIEYRFDQELVGFENSILTITRIKDDGAAFPSEAISPKTPILVPHALSFHLSKAQVNEISTIEFFVELKEADGSVKFTSMRTAIDLGFVNKARESVKDLSARLDAETAARNKLEQEKGEEKSKNETLQTTLNSIIEGHQPSGISLNRVELVTDDRIALTIRTNRPGRVKATIKGENGFFRDIETPDITSLHNIVFEGLSPNSPYNISVVALSLAEKSPIPGVFVSSATDDRLKITTKNPVVPPLASAQIKTLSDRIVVEISSNQDVFASIAYTPFASDGTEITSKTKKVGNVAKNEFGGYSGNESVTANMKRELTLEGLEPNTQYLIVVNLTTDQGKSPSNTILFNARTLPTPVTFDFAQGINLRMSPLGIDLSWESTTVADNATVQFIFGKPENQEITIKSNGKIEGNKITANVTTADVMKMIATNEVPIIRVSMKKESESVQRDLQISYVMPTKSEVEGNTAITKSVSDALLEVIKRREDNRSKLNWKTILSSGFSMFVKALVPIP